MKDKPLVSIIVPVYNGAEFVDQTIESILNQIYDNFELIIIDDASTDNSVEVINRYKDVRIKKIFHKENKNVCISCNEAYALAKGVYIAGTGHDDIWKIDKLEKQVKFMTENPEYGVCFSKADVIDENGRIVNENEECQSLFNRFNSENRSSNEWIKELIQNGNFFCAPTMLIRREILRNSFYRETFLQLQDFELWLYILQKSKVYIYPERLLQYRRFLNSDRNLSSMSEEPLVRASHENDYIIYHFIRDMEGEKFFELFGEELGVPKEDSENFLKCARAFILYRYHNPYCLEYFTELMGDSGLRECMEEKYGFTLKEYYKMMGETFWFDTDSCQKYKEAVEGIYNCNGMIEQLNSIIQRQNDIINQLMNHCEER